MVYQHVQDVPVPPSQLPEGQHIPQELDGLVMRSLAKDPDDRFQSAEEMRALVQYALQMLQEQGPNSGTWNTGPVTMALPHGQVYGGAPTTPMRGPGGPRPPYGQNATTSQFQRPMVPALNPDDGTAFPGGGGRGGHGQGQGGGYGPGGGYDGYDGYDDRRGGSRWKMWVFAVLAVLAIMRRHRLRRQDGGRRRWRRQQAEHHDQQFPERLAELLLLFGDHPLHGALGLLGFERRAHLQADPGPHQVHAEHHADAVDGADGLGEADGNGKAPDLGQADAVGEADEADRAAHRRRGEQRRRIGTVIRRSQERARRKDFRRARPFSACRPPGRRPTR